MGRLATLVFLLALSPTTAIAQTVVCELLKKGSPSFPLPQPQPVATPDISRLVTQIYSTRDLEYVIPDTTPAQSQKCAIASDFAEVEDMMYTVGFAGFGVSDPDTPLFTNTFVKQIQSIDDQDIIRNVVEQFLDPSGDAAPAMAALKARSDLYDDRILNVYYVHSDPANSSQQTFDYVQKLTGMHVRDEHGNSEKMIFINEAADADTVMHEFGHAFSLGHANFWDFDGKIWCAKYLPLPELVVESERVQPVDCGPPETVDMACEFSQTNIMWARGSDRELIGDPQKERMMRNNVSIIAEFSPSTKPLDCPDYSSSPGDPMTCDDDCPRMKGTM